MFPSDMSQDLGCLELFAGEGAVNKGFQRLGWSAAAVDLRYGECMNILAASGFACGPQCMSTILQHTSSPMVKFLMGRRLSWKLTLRLRPNGILWAAPVCSSWVYMSRGSTLRTPAVPEGDTSLASVQQANVMANRVVLLIRLAMSRGVHWVVEQPCSSVMTLMTRWQTLMEETTVCPAFLFLSWVNLHNLCSMFCVHEVYKHRVVLGTYGAESMKPVYLWSDLEVLHQLHRPVTREHREQWQPTVP